MADLVVQDPAYNGRFQGWAVGNPSTDHEYDTFFESTLPTVHGHALISDETHDNLIRYCTGSMPNHVECNKAELKFEENMQDIDPYDMYSPCFTQRSGYVVCFLFVFLFRIVFFFFFFKCVFTTIDKQSVVLMLVKQLNY